MFRRLRGALARPPGFACVDLGVTQDLAYARRLLRLVIGLWRSVRRSSLLRACDVVYARNIDMLGLAVLARVLSRSRAAVVYEVLDVRSAFLGDGPKARLFRLLERWLLRQCRLLIVSSPDYVGQYFGPVQGYSGEWLLLENKLAHDPASGPKLASPPPAPPWIVAWFGVLKCRRSFDILTAIADRLGDQVQIVMRGLPTESHVPLALIEQTCRARTNMIFHGAYDGARDLPAAYGAVHLTWAADFLDPDFNSRWCLANRIYEGGAFGAVAIAAAETASGRMIEREKLGWTINEPLEETAPRFLAGLDHSAYNHMRAGVLSAPRNLFIDIDDTERLVAALRNLVSADGTEVATGSIAGARESPRP